MMIILIVIISLAVLIFVHELGHFLAAKFFGVKVEEFGIGFPPRLFSKKIGETRYSFNALPLGGFVRIYGENSAEREERSFSTQSIWRRSVIILAGIFMNILLGWAVLSLVFMLGSPQHLMIADVASQSPAQEAGLLQGDVVLKVSYQDYLLEDPIKSDEFIDLINVAPGALFTLELQRGDDIVETSVRGRLRPPEGQGSLGVALVEIGLPAQSFFQSLWHSVVTTISALQAIVIGFVTFFTSLFVSLEALETIMGPVGIFNFASQAGSLGLVYLLQLMALISLNLAVLNLIPFPALDGGRFLFLLIEKLKGSPISTQVQVVINSLGFVVLILLLVMVTINDIGRIIN